MKIAVFSDFHAYGGHSSWNAFFDKRAIALLNYLYFRKHRHKQELLEKMVKKITEIKPDVVICVGDISTSGELTEFDIACKYLKPLVENQNFDMFYIPGNHDYYVNDEKCFKALKETFCYLNRGKLKLENLPISLIIKGINFCFVNVCKPSNLFLSSAVMSKENSDYILQWAESNTKMPKVLVDHYPLIEEHPLLRWRHRLYEEKAVLSALKDKKIDLSLCGHVHYPAAKIDNRGRGEIIAGSITANRSFALIEYNEKEDKFEYNKIFVE
jgi:predicted MPP superfamily phosphohydrolase